MKKEKLELETKLKMISAATETLALARKQDVLDIEKVLRQVSDIISKEKIEEVKIGMIAASSKALSMLQRNPNLKDKEILKQITNELPEIYDSITNI